MARRSVVVTRTCVAYPVGASVDVRDSMTSKTSDAVSFHPAAHAARLELAGTDTRALRRELERATARLCPPWLGGSADDIVHEAYLRVVRAAGRSGVEPTRRSYLWKVVYTTMVDWMRREDVRRRGIDAGIAVDSVAGGATPEASVDARQIGAHIHDCVDRLPAARKPVVALYLQGHGASEIAGLLGAAYKNVENLLYRGLAQVRACLQKKGVTP